MFAYTDESGNTGLGVFDADQPVFSTLTLIATHEIDHVLAPRHAEWLREIGVPRLHANELGLARIESLADSARQFIELVDARFILTAIHKPYFAAVKFVDAVLDSGINKGMDPLHYGLRGLRLPLALALVRSMEKEDVVRFWDAWGRRDASTFTAVVRRVRTNVREYPDARIAELLDDALAWAESHPLPILDERRSKLDAPNIVALTLIVNALHQLVGEDGGSVLRFVHDSQQQFAKSLKDVFDVVRRLAPTKHGPTSTIIDMEIVRTFGCSIELLQSGTSPTLQLVDTLLWLARRTDDLVNEPRARACRALVREVERRTVASEFSYRQLERDVHVAHEAIMSVEITAEQAVRGEAFLREVEESRRRRMAEPADE